MLEGEYLEAKKLSERIAADMEPPRFYQDNTTESEASKKIFHQNATIQECLLIMEKRRDRVGHGLSHVRKVALDTGTLILIERNCDKAEGNVERMVLLGHLAGLLHDIKREEPDHAHRGAIEAGHILKTFDLSTAERRAITQAIGNHEAFKPEHPLDETSMQLLSDALYDADKFRWGPDNFTETVWLMVAPRKIPLKVLLDHFLPSLRGIEKISETFRTPTGRKYGPDFISRGLKIGKLVHAELVQRYVQN
ncbi:hypothetical protein ACFL9T_21250 [Thermodesulfobacteriota bacterium]